jgi:hypothetical protein
MDPSTSKIGVTLRIRRCRATHILDRSGSDRDEAAIYALADPRDVALVRYVGQTRSPYSRFSQHLNAARLWLPDELPWWIKRTELRPLYQWIRDLYQDGRRLPVMSVIAWSAADNALDLERAYILRCLGRGVPLLNREAQKRTV